MTDKELKEIVKKAFIATVKDMMNWEDFRDGGFDYCFNIREWFYERLDDYVPYEEVINKFDEIDQYVKELFENLTNLLNLL